MPTPQRKDDELNEDGDGGMEEHEEDSITEGGEVEEPEPADVTDEPVEEMEPPVDEEPILEPEVKKKGKKRKAKGEPGEKKKTSKKKKKRKLSTDSIGDLMPKEDSPLTPNDDVDADADYIGEPVRKSKKPKMDKVQKSSAEICADYGIQDVQLEYTDADYQNLTTYKLFSQHIRPLLAKENPKLAMAKMVMLIGAKWREFLSANPNKDAIQEAEASGRGRSRKLPSDGIGHCFFCY